MANLHDAPPVHRAPSGPGEDIRPALDALLADRASPEARALLTSLSAYAERRARQRARARYADILGDAEVEECVSEVMFELISGALANFRGEGLHSLLAYVRCVTDRVVWRAANRRIRERELLAGPAAEAVSAWVQAREAPDAGPEPLPDCPMPEADLEYLRALLAAGGRARYATAAGVSRAAVTQRVQRIKLRIERLSEDEQAAAQRWIEHEAALASARL